MLKQLKIADSKIDKRHREDMSDLTSLAESIRHDGLLQPIGVKLPWNKQVFLADVATYQKRGIRHITTFAAWIDADYRDRYGDLTFIEEYGEGLSGN